jgi:flagellar protein FlaG
MDVAPLNTAPQAAAPAPVSLSAEQQVQNRQLIQAVQAVNAAELFGQDSELTFALERRTQRALVRLLNRKTRELIRDIPADELLRLAETADAED